MQQKILEPLSPMTQSSLLSFAELFSFMMSEGGRSRGEAGAGLGEEEEREEQHEEGEEHHLRCWL